MNKTLIVTIAWLGWFTAAPAIGADFPTPSGVKPASQSAQQDSPAAVFRSSSHPAVKEVLAGLAERERALGLAAQLDDLDYEELIVWEQLIPTLPGAALTPDAREHEAAMRLGALPLLAARQKEYRALEFELGRGLVIAASSKPDEASVGTQVVRLASIREWSGLIEQAQRQTRITLDAMHSLVLARASKARLRMDPGALAALGRIRERRSRVDESLVEAANAWEVRRDAARLEQWQQDLGTAMALARAAGINERRSAELRQRAADDALPASLRELLRRTAGALDASAGALGSSASDRAGIVDMQAESFLAEPRNVDAADTELAALLAERRRLAHALRASLAARAATLAELKTLADQRERLLAGAGYLAPSEDQRRARVAVQRAATAAWQRVGEFRAAAGDINGAQAGERAHAAEMLGVALEDLVVLEGQLDTLAVGQLLDPTPRPSDPRLASMATRWTRDVDALQALSDRQTTWRKAWDERGGREEEYLAALRTVVGRTNQLWGARIAALATALPARAGNDDISRLTIGIVGSASAHAQALSGVDRDLRRLRDEAEADPVVGAVWKAAGAFRWSHASEGLRELPHLFDQVARMRVAGQFVQVALSPALPSAQRLAALMWLSEALGVPWLALASGPDMQVTTELADETYLLEGLGGNSPQLKRQREFFVGAPVHLAALSMNGLQLAQAVAPPNQSQPLRGRFFSRDPIVDPVPISPRTVTMIAYHTSREIFDNRGIYLGMPAMGAAGGTVLGTVGGPLGSGAGFVSGLSAGIVAVPAAIAEDAIAGGAKGLVKGLAADLRRSLPADYRGARLDSALGWIERHTEAGVDAVKACIALSSIVKRVTRRVDPESERFAANLASRAIAQGRQGIQEAGTAIREASAQLRGLPLAERLALSRAIREMQARADAARKLVEGLSAERTLARLAAEWRTAAAEILSEVNDASGPDMAYAAFVRDLLRNAAASLTDLAMGTSPDKSVTGGQSTADPSSGTASSDPEGERSLALNRRGAQQRSGEAAQRSAGAATTQDSRPSSDKLLQSLDSLQREMTVQWEDKKAREALRRAQDKDKDKDKDKKEKDATATGDEVKTPVKPITPPPVDPDPSKTEPSGPEKKYWYGFDAVISYKFKGAPCTQTLSGEAFGTRAEAEQAMRDAVAKALGASVSNRSDVALVRRGLYAGPLPSRPTYPGPTGLKAVQCASVATTVTPPPAAPTQQANQWYMLEATINWTETVLVADRSSRKVNCTVTDWYARQLLQSEVQEALRKLGNDLLSPRRNYENARVVSTRVVQGPSATKPQPPAAQGQKPQCGQPY